MLKRRDIHLYCIELWPICFMLLFIIYAHICIPIMKYNSESVSDFGKAPAQAL